MIEKTKFISKQLKKFWSYQRILSASFNIENSQISKKYYFFGLFITLILIGIVNAQLDGSGIMFSPVIATLFLTSFIINSQSRLLEILPVKKLYTLVNMYLFPFVVSIIFIAWFCLIFLPAQIISNFWSLINSLKTSIIISSADDWKAAIILILICIILVNVLLPIFFIKNKFIRRTFSALVYVGFLIGLKLFRNTLPVVKELGKINFLESIKILPYYSTLAISLAVICLFIIPISFFISYKLYMKRGSEYV